MRHVLEANIGVLASFISYIIRLEMPKILLINFIPRERTRFKPIQEWVYRVGLRNVTAYTVAADGLKDVYSRRFDARKRSFTLPDVPHFAATQVDKVEDYVFVGGASHRDWQLMLKVADTLPAIHFVFLAGRKGFPVRQSAYLANVTTRFDTTQEGFY